MDRWAINNNTPVLIPIGVLGLELGFSNDACRVRAGFWWGLVRGFGGLGFWLIGVLVDWGFGGLGFWWIGVLVFYFFFRLG